MTRAQRAWRAFATPVRAVRDGLLFVLCLVAGAAQAQDAGVPAEPAATPLVVGVYAPLTFFPNSSARNQYAAHVAQALEAAIGMPMRGRGFAKGFSRDGVDFAIVGATQLAQAGYPPLAQATWRGKPSRAMVLVVGGGVAGGNIGALKGASLARPPVPKAEAFVANFLLQRQVDAGYFKPAGRKPADAQGALSLVRLGRADATFTFEGNEAGMRRVFVSRPMPLPVFVQVRKDLPDETVAKVRKAITTVSVGNSVFDGFAAFSANVHASLRGALDSGTKRTPPKPVVAVPRTRLPPVPSFLDAGDPAVVMPRAADDLAVPDPPGDGF